ncbi:hypothetical protein [Halopseudomonas sabulinigri]|uniref:hypothetical protein n=1 Tax=Halopseudomonas sabulinigri TaxID=472181 RepID=UPI0033420DD4
MSAWDLTAISLTSLFGVLLLYVVGCHFLRFVLAYSPWPITADGASSDRPALFSRFRVKRYLVALLWHWTFPFMIGAVTASIVSASGILHAVDSVGQALDASMQRMIDSCTTEASETAEISEAKRSLFPLARGPTSPTGALVLSSTSGTRPN